MANIKIEEFNTVSLSDASIQFIEGNNQLPGTKFGCIGTLEGESEVKTIVKKCAGMEVRSKTKTLKMNLKVKAHLPISVARDIFGLDSSGLKPGVYSYGQLSKGKAFVLTANVIDEFQDLVKLIAFPNCSNTSGFKIVVENGTDEVAELELEFTSLADNTGRFYYEALVSELDDQTIVEQWHTNFTSNLVESVPTP